MKCDYGCYYVAPSQDDDEAYYGVAFVLANLWSPSASFWVSGCHGTVCLAILDAVASLGKWNGEMWFWRCVRFTAMEVHMGGACLFSRASEVV